MSNNDYRQKRYKLYYSAVQNQIYTKTYYNVMITGIDEFDLGQESDGKLKNYCSL